MDLEDSSGVKRNSQSLQQLVRNSSIAVTIDDLAEGLLVVSFTHSDNLYQGVLFQLNRERGIPFGISFAKEQALGNSSTEKAENDAVVAVPLHLRHTYSQGNGSSNGPPPSIGTISQPSLRRIIKPPARFKNARMSLRLRARPVLCAKCRTLCDDKADSNGKEENSKDDNQTDKTKKEKLTKVDVIATTTSSLNGKLKGGDQIPSSLSSSSCLDVIDPKDLAYESVGSTRVVENFWKRPLVQPLIASSEETYARLKKHKAPIDAKDRKRVKASCSSVSAVNSTNPSGLSTDLFNALEKTEVAKASSSNAATENGSLNMISTNSTLRESTVCDNNFPNTRSRKALNLKMCITKLTNMRDGTSDETNSKSNTWCSTVIDTCADNTSHSSPNHSDSSESTSVSSPNSTTLANSKSDLTSRFKGSAKRSKEWENRIRKKSTVPVRFRDESYLTKNIFNFNKRRPIDGSGEIPVLTICRSDDANTFKVSTLSEPTDSTVTTTNNENEDDDDSSSTPTTIPTSCTPPLQPESASTSLAECSSSSSPSPTSSSSHFNELQSNFSIKPSTCKPSEVIKTPTIKITFGSSRMVVQIPPKVTQHLECSSTTEMKAARKAMKKAKKEARRKLSLSGELSCNSMSPDALKCERSNPPSPATLNEPQSSTISTFQKDFESTEPHQSDVSPSLRSVTKKKKKQKKRRRSSKIFKENDGFTSSSSSHDIGGFAMSSPCSNSSLNHDFVSHGPGSPSGTSVKSCNFDSISNPDTHEQFPSFCKDASPPSRRRSVPASSTTTSADAPRVCINLKRIDTNAYVPLPLHTISAHSDRDPSSQENNGLEIEDSEPNDFPVNSTANGNDFDDIAASAETVEYYKDKDSECTYRKGDVIWGKLPSCPWWPGKISDIFKVNADDTRAKISWYKSTTQSYIRFKMIEPFSDCFDNKYIRGRRRGPYQLAVRDALMEAHKLNPEDLPTD